MPHISKHLLRSISLAALVFLSACARERVVLLEPKEDDLVVVNGCVVSACNYLALVKAKHQLEPNFWTKILLVRYDDHPAGHAYCVWETEGTIYGYDRNSGGFPIPVYTRDPRAIAIVLAQELSRIMKEPLSVRTAEFVDPEKATLYKYASTNAEPPPLLTTTAGPFRPITLSLSDQKVRPRLSLGMTQVAAE
jgi:hypothetical protein